MKSHTPSATARLVAFNLAVIAACPETSALVTPEAAEITRRFLRSAGWLTRLGVCLLRRHWFRRRLLAAERHAIAGLALHQALRKRVIESRVRSAISEGIDQLVVLGGGLDTLAVRLSREMPSLSVWELDHPATQSLKDHCLREGGGTPANLHLVPVDFALADVASVLANQPGFRPDRPAVLVCEGVLMYLEEAEVRRLFSSMRLGGTSRWVFTYLEGSPTGGSHFAWRRGVVSRWLRWQGEPFRWRVSTEALRPFLEEFGLYLETTIPTADMAEARVSDSSGHAFRVARGEGIGAARPQALAPPAQPSSAVAREK